MLNRRGGKVARRIFVIFVVRFMRCHTKLHKAHKPYLQLYPFHALTFTESTARTTREEEPQLRFSDITSRATRTMRQTQPRLQSTSMLSKA